MNSIFKMTLLTLGTWNGFMWFAFKFNLSDDFGYSSNCIRYMVLVGNVCGFKWMSWVDIWLMIIFSSIFYNFLFFSCSIHQMEFGELFLNYELDKLFLYSQLITKCSIMLTNQVKCSETKIIFPDSVHVMQKWLSICVQCDTYYVISLQ